MASPQFLDTADCLAPAAATLARVSAIVVPKRTRVSRPKVRTGCGTCKKRHVKCDERRPSCLRCEQAGTECAGYTKAGNLAAAAAAEGKSSKRVSAKGQLTKPKSAMQRANKLLTPDSIFALGCSIFQPTPPRFALKADEVVYYDFFRNQLAHELSGFIPSNIWTKTVLGESMRNPCVMHSVIAISALWRSINQDPVSQQLRSEGLPALAVVETTQGLDNVHAQHAVYHYAKAMEVFRKRISAGTVVPSRDVLIGTLLFVAYELLQGNVVAADSLLSSGVVLLKDTIKLLQPVGTLPEKPGTGGDEVEEIEHMLTRMLISNSFSPFSSPHGSLAGIQLLTAPYGNVPTLGETNTAGFFQLWNEFSTRAFIFVKFHLVGNLLNKPFDVEEAEREQAEFLRLLKLWETVTSEFIQHGEDYIAGKAPLQARSVMIPEHYSKEFSDKVLRGLRIVQIHNHMCTIFVSSCLDQSGLAFDAFNDSFRAILDISAPLVAASVSAKQTQFTFDIAIAPMVGFVITCCRDRKIRMDGIDLYRKMTWREGAWDNRALVIGKLGLIYLEDTAADANGFIPPGSRYFWTGGSWDVHRRKLIATYHRHLPDRDGNPVTKTLELDVPWS